MHTHPQRDCFASVKVSVLGTMKNAKWNRINRGATKCDAFKSMFESKFQSQRSTLSKIWLDEKRWEVCQFHGGVLQVWVINIFLAWQSFGGCRHHCYFLFLHLLFGHWLQILVFFLQNRTKCHLELRYIFLVDISWYHG